MMPSEAIVAATKTGAQSLPHNMGDKLGTIEVGKIADLVMLDADPLADIHNVERIKLVIKDGVVIDRDRLPSDPLVFRSAAVDGP